MSGSQGVCPDKIPTQSWWPLPYIQRCWRVHTVSKMTVFTILHCVNFVQHSCVCVSLKILDCLKKKEEIYRISVKAWLQLLIINLEMTVLHVCLHCFYLFSHPSSVMHHSVVGTLRAQPPVWLLLSAPCDYSEQKKKKELAWQKESSQTDSTWCGRVGWRLQWLVVVAGVLLLNQSNWQGNKEPLLINIITHALLFPL